MIKVKLTFPSACLGRDADVTVLLPKTAAPAGGYPTLYLLHGLTDCAETWIYRTALERYCDDHAMAVVLPTAARSFYCDMVSGDAYYTHVSREVPDLCESLLPLAADGGHRYIAGNSMGGYGAYKIAVKNPGRFSKAAAFSGVLDINGMIRDFPEYARDWQLCFGGQSAPAQEDLLELVPKAEVLPKLYQYCGTDDFLAEGNRRFAQLCQEENIPLTTVWEEKGIHDWNYWDPQLPRVLDWLEE